MLLLHSRGQAKSVPRLIAQAVPQTVGIVALTLLINGTTAGLVYKVGIGLAVSSLCMTPTSHPCESPIVNLTATPLPCCFSDPTAPDAGGVPDEPVSTASVHAGLAQLAQVPPSLSQPLPPPLPPVQWTPRAPPLVSHQYDPCSAA